MADYTTTQGLTHIAKSEKIYIELLTEENATISGIHFPRLGLKNRSTQNLLWLDKQNYNNNIVTGYAIDFTLGYYWIQTNGTWSTSNPETGENPYATFSPNLNEGYEIIAGAGTNTRGTINLGQIPYTYVVPSGFNQILTEILS